MKKQASALCAGLLCVSFAWGNTVSGFSQNLTTQEPDAILKVSTSLVQIDAVVVDKQGRHVTNLTAEDFEILEDKQPQPISNFAYVSLQPVAGTNSANLPLAKTPKDEYSLAPASSLPRTENIRRSYVLVVDDLNLSAESIRRVQSALKSFLIEQMQPFDLVAILQTGKSQGILQQFTNDKRRLLGAVQNLHWNPAGRGRLSGASWGSDRSTSQATGGKGGLFDAELAENLNAGRTENLIGASLSALRLAVKGLENLPGRKSILFLSDGLPQLGTGNSRLHSSFEKLVQQANRSEVVVYPIEATGLETGGLTGADRVSDTGTNLSTLQGIRTSDRLDSQQGLRSLARETGGVAFLNSNNLNHSLGKVLEEQRGYYLLGYVLTNPADGDWLKAHRLAVRVKRPELTVRTRNGFYTKPAEPERLTETTSLTQMIDSILSPFATSQLHTQVTCVHGLGKENKPFVRTYVWLDPQELSFSRQDNLQVTTIEILTAALSENGEVVAQNLKKLKIGLADADYQAACQKGLLQFQTLPFNLNGGFQFRVAVRDVESGKIGSGGHFLEIQDGKKHALVSSSLIAFGQTQPGTNNPQLVLDPQSSPALRKFPAGSEVNYQCAVFPGGKKPKNPLTTLESQILVFKGDELVLSGTPKALLPLGEKQEHLVAQGTFQLSSKQAPGEYTIQLVIRDKQKGTAPPVFSQWTDFEVIP
ncbi:MAG: VWA domain-containing protein [Blastocatellia bacterium]|nr:VWA domain-containing protein [Blastocatellia bacterium]